MKSKSLLLLLFVAFSLTLNAQSISVKLFKLLPTDMTASSLEGKRIDQNNEAAALIRVVTSETDFSFEAGALGIVDTKQKVGEIWVWVPRGSRKISIMHQKLGVLREYRYPIEIEAERTYEMQLTTGKVIIDVEEDIQQQYLTFQISPSNAVLEVNGQLWEVGPDGSSTKFVDFGTYKYRVQAPNYHSDAGMVTLNEPGGKKQVNVTLKPDFVEVTLKADADAEIWVNNEKKGVGSWTGPLGKGTYMIECKKANHETSKTSQEITDALNGSTITLPAPQPIYGSLNVESTPNYTSVYLDGKPMGETPLFIKEVLIGTHELKLTKEGHNDHTETLTLVKGERKQVKAEMNNADYDKIALKGDEYFDAKNYEEALKCYREAAEQGNAIGQNGMGRLYDLQQDYAEAVKWYRLAAKQGLDRAQCNLGSIYNEGAGVSQDYAEAVKWYRKAAEQGNASGQCNLGYMYDVGHGVTQDYAEAIKWYRKAAEQGNARAQNNLGVLYEKGYGVTQNNAEAIRWYKKAAEQGNAYAQNNLGLRYLALSETQDFEEMVKSYEEAAKWFGKAAEQGFAEAQYNLGWYYENKRYEGRDWIPDYQEAAKWYQKAAEQGHIGAQYSLGGYYDYIEGEYGEAFKWYQKAAEQENASAQNELGRCYYEGKSVKKDINEAIIWFRKAAEQGNEWSQFYLGKCYYNGEGVQKNINEAVKWFKKALEHDMIDISLEKDLKSLIRKAAEQGNKEAKDYLNSLDL